MGSRGDACVYPQCISMAIVYRMNLSQDHQITLHSLLHICCVLQQNREQLSHTGSFEIWAIEVGIQVKNNFICQFLDFCFFLTYQVP